MRCSPPPWNRCGSCGKRNRTEGVLSHGKGTNYQGKGTPAKTVCVEQTFVRQRQRTGIIQAKGVPVEGLKGSWETKKVRLNLSQPPRSQCQFLTESHQTSKNFREMVFLLHFLSRKLGIKGEGRSEEATISSCLMQAFMSTAYSWFQLAECMCAVCGLHMLTIGLTFDLIEVLADTLNYTILNEKSGLHLQLKITRGLFITLEWVVGLWCATGPALVSRIISQKGKFIPTKYILRNNGRPIVLLKNFTCSVYQFSNINLM